MTESNIYSVEQVMQQMQQDIRCDIYGDIYNHDRWAEEIVQLRSQVAALSAEVSRLKARQVDQSWTNSPDRSGGQFTQEEIYRDGDRWCW